MNEPTQPADLPPPRDRYSANERFLRYANGRIRQFWQRQILTALGSAGIAFAISPALGGVALFVALAGELLDLTVLRLAVRSSASGSIMSEWKVTVAASGAIQAITIAICVLIPILGSQVHAATFFSCAFLTAATINAGLILPHYKPAAWSRLLVYCACLAAVILALFSKDQQSVLDLLAITTSAVSAAFFIRHVSRSNLIRRRAEQAMIEQGKELAQRVADLERVQSELDTLALVARHANDSVILSSADGRIKWVNEAFTKITGYSAEEAIGTTPADLLNSPRASIDASQEIVHAKKQGRVARIEVLNSRKDGTDIWMETSIVPILDDVGQVKTILSVERDITNAKSLETELRAARKAAEDGARIKSQFLATISHEIRTPMNAVLGMSELLVGANLSSEERLYAQTINESASALLDIVNDVLDLSKLEAGKFSLNVDVFDLRKTVASAASLFRAAAEKKGLRYQLSIGQDLPEFVIGDAGRLRQILVNVIGNALKFTHEGEISISVSGPGADQFILFEVCDSGIGIAPQKLAHVFEEFSQAEHETAQNFGGTGLGLTISRHFAKLMGGDISVASTLGSGSTFSIRVRLPAAQNARQQAAPTHEPVRLPKGIRLLVADDNETNRLLVKKFLSDQPVQLTEATDGVAVLETLESLSPDIILMDMQMPKMDGLTATRAVRDLGQDVRQPVIIALTANADAEDHMRCLSAGMDLFLAKPLSKQALLGMLDRACQTSKAGRTQPHQSGLETG